MKLIQNINHTPTESYCKEHYFCDYIEILALINNQDIISISDVFDRFRESKDIDIDIDEDIDVQATNTSSVENIPDKWDTRINEWFTNIATRNTVFNDFYPFVVKSNNIQLKESLTNHHKTYIFLLLSSNQKYISSIGNCLPNDFEEVSLIALKNYLPKSAKSYIFGKSSGRYVGTLEKKIRKLAEDDLRYKVKATNFQDNDTGDGGLDLVAWLPFLKDTNQNNIQIFLAQCATGKNWQPKQWETIKITNYYIDFKTQVNYVFFMPYDCRDVERNFSEESDVFDGLFFDRIRILYLLENEIDSVMNFASFNSIVNNAISYEEAIV